MTTWGHSTPEYYWDWFLRASQAYPLLALRPPAVLVSWHGTNTSRDPAARPACGR